MHGAACALLHAWEKLKATASLPAGLEMPLHRRFIRLDALPVLVDSTRSLLHPSILGLARDYLGHEPELALNSHVRSITVDRPDAHMPFHQDETILGRPLINVWIALDPCGRTLPGLEVVWNSWAQRLPPSPEPSAGFPVEYARLDPGGVLGLFGEAACWAPQFEPGDAMIFSGATVHRTHVRREMHGERLSVEIRLI